jgi:hypothetical protein
MAGHQEADSSSFFVVDLERSKIQADRLKVFPELDRTRVARGPFLTSPLGANFDPRGEFVP